MRLSHLSLFTAVYAALVATGVGQQPTQTDDRIQGWRGDIDFLQAAVAREHYLFRTRPLPENFLKYARELKSTVAQLSDEQVLAELQRLMTTLGDGHCSIAPSPKFMQKSPLHELPLRLHAFSDGLFVVAADDQGWIGRRITRLGSVPAADALRRIAEYVPKDNILAARWWGPVFLGYRGPLEALGCVDSKAQEIMLGFAGAGGTESEAPVRFIPMRMTFQAKLEPSRLADSPPVPLYLRHVTSNYWFEPLQDRRAVYFQFNQVMNSPEESLETFSARLDASLASLRPRLLIVDVRFNSGGNADLLGPLVRVMQEVKHRDPAAKLVVITGPCTFSAAQIFISTLDRDTKPIFAGEPSGSKPNFVGEENPVELPWSGVFANISNRYHEIIPGDTRQWIEPEIKVELSSRDYFQNRDPVLESVLARFDLPEK